MVAQQSNGKIFGRFDPIHIGLAVTTVIFLILSIVFIILFATKHDTSTGFLTTGFSSSKPDEVSNELKGLLNKKFTVNSFALDIENTAVSAVFSLRDSVSTNDVQNLMAQSKLMTQPQTTYGDKATAVCRQANVFASTTQAPTTQSKAPTTTPTPVVSTRYCSSNPITRDMVIVVDMDDQKSNNHTEKLNGLNQLRKHLNNGLTFPQANVLLKAVVNSKVVDVSTNWISSVDQLNLDFTALLALTSNKSSNFNFGDAMSSAVNAFNNGRKFVPGAIFMLTDKPLLQPPTVKARDMGYFVAVAGVRDNYIKPYGNYADLVASFDSWTLLANADPFSTFVCNFYQTSTPTKASRFEYPLSLDDTTNYPKCQVLDIIIAFDTSESLSRLILPRYVDFANRIVAQYKYKNDEFTRVGVITFNSQVTELLTLTQGTTLNVVNAAINSVNYTGGLTDVTSALVKAKDLFQQESPGGARSKVLIVLSDAVPTVDTYQDEIAAGQDLAKLGVATFFVGYSSYTDDVKKELGQVTNPNYVFGDMSEASFNGITNQILATYPCPLPKCVTAYFAVEISEATADYVVQNLKDVLTIANKASTFQTGTESYQLISYNEDNTQINPQGDASLKSFTTYVQGLINDPTKIAALRGGYTRLDTAINDVSAEMARQEAKNSRFSSNIIFFGEANDAVLDPNKPIETKRALLQAAAANLKTHTAGLIYVVDDSRPAQNFGPSLWDSVTSKDRIIIAGDNNAASLDHSDYYTTWQTLSCSLPQFSTCYYTQLDVAVLIDLQNTDYKFMNYITSLLSQFTTDDDTHVSLFAYGARDTSVLSGLGAHSQQEIQNYAVVYEDWSNGTWFITTTPAPTTPEPSTSSVGTTGKPANFWTNDLYVVDKTKIHGVFDTLSTQFGCGHYSQDGDRIFAPNLFIFASDNFGSYTDQVWDDFQTELHDRFGCWDCAGAPSFLFLSRNVKVEKPEIGPTIVISDVDLDIDRSDDTSTQANINKFNGLVNSICTAQLPSCASYTCFAG